MKLLLDKSPQANKTSEAYPVFLTPITLILGIPLTFLI